MHNHKKEDNNNALVHTLPIRRQLLPSCLRYQWVKSTAVRVSCSRSAHLIHSFTVIGIHNCFFELTSRREIKPYLCIYILCKKDSKKKSMPINLVIDIYRDIQNGVWSTFNKCPRPRDDGRGKWDDRTRSLRLIGVSFGIARWESLRKCYESSGKSKSNRWQQ